MTRFPLQIVLLSPGKRQALIVITIVIAVAIADGNVIVSRFISNLGRIALIHTFNRREAKQQEYLSTSEKMLHSAVSIDPENSRAWGSLGLNIALQKRTDEASKTFDNSLQRMENYLVAGDRLFEYGSFDESIHWYKLALAEDPGVAENWFRLAEALDNHQLPEDALIAYMNAWSINNELGAEKYANSILDAGDIDLAELILREALLEFADSKKRIDWWRLLGQTLVSQEKWEDGIQVYYSALREYPEDKQLMIGMGWLKYHRGDGPEAAIQIFEKAETLNNRPGIGYAAAAEVSTLEGRHDAAVNWYGRAIFANQGSRAWYLERARAAVRAGDAEIAIGFYKKTTERFPDYGRPFLELANLYKEVDEKNKAVSTLDNALSIIDDPHWRNLLLAAEIYEWAGVKTKAREAYEMVLATNPENRKALSALAQLDEDE